MHFFFYLQIFLQSYGGHNITNVLEHRDSQYTCGSAMSLRLAFVANPIAFSKAVYIFAGLCFAWLARSEGERS